MDKYIEPKLIRIPVGDFLMGSHRRKDPDATEAELPQHRLRLNEYWIGRFPVTNEEYRYFLLDNPSVKHPAHWAGAWDRSEYSVGESLHPVSNVTWHDALAYCRWLSDLTGCTYNLPSEAEWEKAARGTDGRLYPWGNKWKDGRFNFTEIGVSGKPRTTPVGVFSPRGDSPYGCVDMAGNVWEWTRSLWGSADFYTPDYRYPYNPADGRENMTAPDTVYRVLRGGSFNDLFVLARCAFRWRRFPHKTLFNIGFRVASPSV